ncbi:unnamed protein product [Linum trigynum]|uniref:Uncharacterized protein n=1 Tax=Linum trigynum TaxID=586398 RepID=A0AAV2EU46_9ROSI
MRALKRTRTASTMTMVVVLMSITNMNCILLANAGDDSNPVFDPCFDAAVAKWVHGGICWEELCSEISVNL